MEQPKTFTCFHCWETFEVTDFASQRRAQDHFGTAPHAQPICKIQHEDRKLIWRIRRMEEELARHRAEDSDTDRAMHAMQARHAEELKRVEEQGFARGVADMRKHGWRLNEERERPDLYPAAVQ